MSYALARRIASWLSGPLLIKSPSCIKGFLHVSDLRNIPAVDILVEIINLVKKYPITKTNEQGVMNLYFYLEKKLYKELPSEIDEFFTYYYWKIADKKIIITKQLIEQYK